MGRGCLNPVELRRHSLVAIDPTGVRDTAALHAVDEKNSTDEKRCLVTANNEHRRLMPTGKERRGNKKMKYLTIIAVAAIALSLGACASKSTTNTTETTTTSASTGYSK
jgi:hypothetical protein